MKRIRSLLITAFLALPVHAQTTAWRPYESAQGRFKVSFPGTPVVNYGKVRTEIGDVLSARHSASDGTEITYDVTYNDYPKEGIAKLSAAKLVDTVRDGLVYQAKGKLVAEKPHSVGKIAGRELEIEGGDGMRYRIRLMLVANRLYQLTAMARPPAQADDKEFFGSFELTGGVPR